MLGKSQKIIFQILAVLKKRYVLIPLQAVLIGAAVALAILSLPNSPERINWSNINFIYIVAGVLFYLAFYFIFAVQWTYAVHLAEKRKIDLNQMLAFFASQPYKYLPTSIFSFSARSIYSKKVGATSIASTVKAQLIEYGSMFGGGGVLIVAVKTNILVALMLLFVLLGLAYLALRKLAVKSKGVNYKIFALILLSICGWLLAGLSFYYIVIAVGPSISIADALFVNTVAFLASIVAVLIPAGIGVREAIFLYQSVSFAGTLAWRVCSMVLDMAVGIIAIIIINKKTMPNKKS